MSAREVVTVYGRVEVKPRTSPRRALRGHEVYVAGRFVGSVLPRDDGTYAALATGLSQRDDPEPYRRWIDAITFLAGVGRERHGRG